MRVRLRLDKALAPLPGTFAVASSLLILKFELSSLSNPRFPSLKETINSLGTWSAAKGSSGICSPPPFISLKALFDLEAPALISLRRKVPSASPL